MFSHTKRIAVSALLAGSVLLGAGDALMNSQTAAHAGAAKHTAGAARTRHARPARLNARQRLSHTFTVQSVGANTITAINLRGVSFTITIGASTTFTEAGAKVSFASLRQGTRIVVRGTYNRAAKTIQATNITISVPSVAGVVTAVNSAASTITITRRNAVPLTITYSAATVFTRASQPAQASDVAVGSVIIAQGTTSNASFTVLRIIIRLPRLAGAVGNLGNGTFTLTNRSGTSYTVLTNSQTKFLQRGIPNASATNLANGEHVLVEGTLSADGKTLTALRVLIARAAPATTPAA